MTKTLPKLQFDNIIVWRHAEAEIANDDLGESDEIRQLTQNGRMQAKRMARWLKKHLPDETILICSPALRALQTAEFLDHTIQLQDGLKPSASLPDVLSVLAKIQNPSNRKNLGKTQKNLLIVGHQPWMGQLVAYLLDQSANDAQKNNRENNISIKKGAAWWLRRYSVENEMMDHQQYKLFTLQTPSLL